MKITRRQLRKLIIETMTPTLQDIQAAQEKLKTRDLTTIPTYLGAQEDEVADILAGGYGISKMDAVDEPLSAGKKTFAEEEYIAEIIATDWEKSVRAERWDGTADTWGKEIDKASEELKRGLIDSGILRGELSGEWESVIALVADVEAKLHNGDFVPGKRVFYDDF